MLVSVCVRGDARAARAAQRRHHHHHLGHQEPWRAGLQAGRLRQQDHRQDRVWRDQIAELT